jgi:hypothetical protein
MDMTKFEIEDDPGFIVVAGELRRWIKELNQVALHQRQIEQQQDSGTIRGIKRHHDGDGFNGHSKRVTVTNRCRRNQHARKDYSDDLDIGNDSDDNDNSDGSDDSDESDDSVSDDDDKVYRSFCFTCKSSLYSA